MGLFIVGIVKMSEERTYLLLYIAIFIDRDAMEL